VSATTTAAGTPTTAAGTPTTATTARAALGSCPRAGARAFLDLDRVDIAWLLFLVALAFLLRAASPIFPDFLSRPFGGSPVSAWGVAYPQTPSSCIPDVPVGPGGAPVKKCGFVFDEVYFPVDAAKDLHQPAIDYFDPEPPLAKLLMAPPIAALGFDNRWSWRLSVVVFGSLLVGVVYLIARRLRRERFFAVAAALFVCCDGLELVESRTGVIDIIAVFFALLLYYAFLLHWQARTRSQWRSTLYAMAVVAGLAFAAKTTALAPLVVSGGLIAARFLEPALGRTFSRLAAAGGGRGAGEAAMWRDAAGTKAAVHYALALLLGFAVFAASYSRYNTIEHNTVYHFADCTPSGGLYESGNASANLIADHQQIPLIRSTAPHFHVVQEANGTLRLAGDQNTALLIAGRAVPNPLTAIANVWGQVRASLVYHSVECRGHPYASRWYTWPVVFQPVLFYTDYGSTTAHGASEVGWITDMGNPALWWAALPALMFCIWRLTRHLRGRLGLCLLPLSALAMMIVGFHLSEHSNTVRVGLSVAFVLGFVLMVVFALVAAVLATLGRRLVPGFILLGYLAAWMMWVPGNGRRVLFFYHMLGALPFMALALAYALTALRRVRFTVAGGRVVSMAPAAYAAVGVVLAAFVFFYPMWTGTPLPQADRDMRTWLMGW